MMCTLEHIRECLKPIKPKELNIPTGIVFPRDQSIKIDAGPLLGLLQGKNFDHICMITLIRHWRIIIFCIC